MKTETKIGLTVFLFSALLIGTAYAGTVGVNNLYGFTNGYGFTWFNSTNVEGTNYYLAGTALNARLGGDYGGFALIGDTLNTGQGVTEVYLQNQDLRTNDPVTFENVTIGDALTLGAVTRTTWPDGGGEGGQSDYTYLVNVFDGATHCYTWNGTELFSVAEIDQTGINWALGNLTAGRTAKEKVVVKGNYDLTSPILVPSYTVLDFSEAYLWLLTGSDCNMVQNTELETGNTHIDIFGGWWEGNKAQQTSGSIIHMETVSFLRVLNGYFLHAEEYAVSLGSEGTSDRKCTYVEISQNHMDRNDGGILDAYTNWGVISENSIRECSYTGLKTKGSYTMAIVDNIFHLCYQYGIHSTGTKESVITGNSMAVYGDIGIWIELGDTFTISGNHINTAQHEAILLDGRGWNCITGNTLSDNGYADGGYPQIHVLSGTPGNTITGNTIRSKLTIEAPYAIKLLSDNNVVADNYIYLQELDAIHIDSGSYNIIEGNRIYNCSRYGIVLNSTSTMNRITNNLTTNSTTACLRIDNANCINNTITGNSFDEGAISDVGGAHNCVAYLNYDPSVGAYIATINSPTIVGGGGGALP